MRQLTTLAGVAVNYAERICDLISDFRESLAVTVSYTIKAISELVESPAKVTAYVKAKEEHPEWLHKAVFAKKKRIRKKYHDRIMREYGG